VRADRDTLGTSRAGGLFICRDQRTTPPDFERTIEFRAALTRLAARDPEVHKLMAEVQLLVKPPSVLRDPDLVERVRAAATSRREAKRWNIAPSRPTVFACISSSMERYRWSCCVMASPTWYSWRHQLRALGEAGFYAVAPDMRGYGNTDRPADIDQYTLLHLTGDMVGLLDALGTESAVVAGHDWALRWRGSLRCCGPIASAA